MPAAVRNPRLPLMEKYRSLVAWQIAHRLSVRTLKITDAAYHPRARFLFDQMRRASTSVEANIVEGYALSTRPQFRRHLRIALASAAEAERQVKLAGEVEYLSKSDTQELVQLTERTMRLIFGLLRKLGGQQRPS